MESTLLDRGRNDATEGGSQADSNGTASGLVESATNKGDLDVFCGPLLNYRGMSDPTSDEPIWHGSVLVVTPPRQRTPELTLRCIGPVEGSAGAHGAGVDASHARPFPGVRVYEDPRKAFWRFQLDLPFQSFEAKWEYHIAGLRDARKDTSGQVSRKTFVVPSKDQSMRILFHSCNGFSVGTDMDVWKGPSLWNDVLRMASSLTLRSSSIQHCPLSLG